ncbi:hypothetical protein AB0F72_35740 [Actinoplanes sp. NPDC023936]|uniref:hypothetical protein n=1 Tax=Actinoplanes sp. NPDC023936 TaxID=3154910 RepID=UPI0033EB8AAD
MSSPADSPSPESGAQSPGAQSPGAQSRADKPSPIEISDGPFRLAEPGPATSAGSAGPADESADGGKRPPTTTGRKVRTVLLGALLVAIGAGSVTLGYVGWQVNTQRHTTLSIPSTIGDLTLDDSEDASSTAEYLRSAISAEITMDKAVGAVYTGADERNVLFFGGTRLLWSPDEELEKAFTLLGDEESPVTGLNEVDAGELGGTMKCGTTTSDGTNLAVCGWADHGSLAVAMFLDRPESDAATLMRQIRTATQTRD